VKFLKIFLLLLVPLALATSIVVLATGAVPYKVYIIHTGSMSPNIPSGSAVLVHEGHYRVGQVVTFTENGLTVTHRLVAINSSGLTTTKGDANPTNDPWHVPTSQIIGGVVVAPRYVGYWITYLKDPLGLGSVFLVCVAIWQLWSLAGVTPVDADERARRTRSEPVPRRVAPPAPPRPEPALSRKSKREAQLAAQRRERYATLFGETTTARVSQNVGAK